jgi:hypothetical protein
LGYDLSAGVGTLVSITGEKPPKLAKENRPPV